jgi:hypothetical protein
MKLNLDGVPLDYAFHAREKKREDARRERRRREEAALCDGGSMTFEQMYAEASALGLPPAEMRRNCEAHLADYERRAAESGARSARSYLWAGGETWRDAAQRCRDLLVWLDARAHNT